MKHEDSSCPDVLINLSHSFITFILFGRFTFERIHITKEQIYFYERAENNKAKERLFESFKCVNFPGKQSDTGADHGLLERVFICIKDVGFALCVLSHLT